MVILIKYEELRDVLEASLEAWMEIGGGPNMDAFDFDPNLVDLSTLDAKGYYTNREAWIAGVQVKRLQKYINENLQDPVKASQNK
jgi:hypothetical protein